MAKKYGNIYKITEFIARIIPKKNTITKSSQEYIITILDFLKELDNIQENNWSITINIHAKDGIYLYYDLQQQFFIKPTQKYLLLHIFNNNKLLNDIDSENNLFLDKIEKEYAQGVWKINLFEEFQWLLKYINNNFTPLKDNPENDQMHSRNIPGYIRQAVLEEFEKNGRYCNGVSGKIKRHKLSKNHPIEFDHIIPYSRGGASSYGNIQILCKECNRIKSATAG